ncbi:MAG: carboxymuconolactone decarboxylase family protein [Acidimicrobiales bacterium]|nr:carboxymuconolactone decarboxylase family protein [Acidimicrobiales bacterium]
MEEQESKSAQDELAEARTATGRRRYREVMVSDAPPPLTPYLGQGVVDSVFGELWDRPGLTRRDRRWITLACVGAAAVDVPIEQHVYAALASGDISREEMQEFVLHFAYYAGWPRASALERAYLQAVQRIDVEGSE